MPKFEMPNTPKLPRTREDIEGEIEFILNQHPEELTERWEKDIEDMQPRAQLTYLRRVAEKRRELLAPKPYESPNLIALDAVPVEVEELFGKQFNEAVKDMDEVNRGYNGRIMAFENHEKYKDVVYKVLIRHPVGKQNDLMSEASYQADMHVVSSEDAACARVPKVHYLATRQNAKIIAMERVPGYSIKEILKKKIRIPSDFDVDAAEKACLTLVEKLHDAGISHNDLLTGNVMLDFSAKGSSSAYIVDAGNSSRLKEGEVSRDAAVLANTFSQLRAARNRTF